MNRLTIWPDFRDDWILQDDGDIVVVDKPEGVPSQSADPERPDDVVTRLRAHLGGAYLGVHQRLDRDTSGLLVFARRREANASLASQFEGRSVRKTYVACVTGWPRGRDRATLRDAIERGEGATMRVATRTGPNAKAAVTHVKVVERRGDRAMLELALETGRTHQARVQLAHAGAPIAGDALYAGAAAPRLMLHASAIDLAHPTSRDRVRFVCPPPPDFSAWLVSGDPGEKVYDDDGALGRALARAVERRWGLGRSDAGPRATTAFRLVNEEGDGLPRLAIDVYGDWLVTQLYGDAGPWADAARRERLIERVHGLGFEGVYLKVRPQQANDLTRTPGARHDELAPAHPVRGLPAPQEVPIVEEGMPLFARLGDGLSTGIFLDQRNNRRRVRAFAEGKSLANLFAYTCSFTVAAALGGARRTVSVDASAAALERGRANLAHAGAAEGAEHTFVADDAFSWLQRATRRDERFDLIVLDPPSYSSTKRGRFVAADDYVGLAAAAIALLGPGGRLLACTNHRGISRARFRRMLFDAARAAKREVTQVKDLPEPQDYPVPPGGEGHTKSVWVSCPP
ncbi:MAG TPA: class I SAM-dependent methyltransferase [Polyangiaceae bacterium]|nr:class I SAM-dependent methyltransferase [Polyangiaceae bacterium]